MLRTLVRSFFIIDHPLPAGYKGYCARPSHRSDKITYVTSEIYRKIVVR